VVVLESGHVIEVGPPEDLIRRGGHFAALVALEEAGWDWQEILLPLAEGSHPAHTTIAQTG
jgi:hypothetical protein